MKVLVADDSENIRRLFVNVLATIGIYNVECACDGREAIDAARRTEFDLILIDWSMPHILGTDAIKEIRSWGTTMPIILITAERDEHLEKEALLLGATDFISKPVRVDVLRGRIEAVLS